MGLDRRGEGTSKMQMQNYLSSGNMPEGRVKIPTVVIFGMSRAFVLPMMKKKCRFPWKESFSFQTKLFQQGFLENMFVHAFQSWEARTFTHLPWQLPLASQCRQELKFRERTLLQLMARCSARAMPWLLACLCMVWQAEPRGCCTGGVGSHGGMWL